MRDICFTTTPAQIRARTQTVTRRLGWVDLTPGTRLQPCTRHFNRAKHQIVTRIGRPIRVVDVRREPLARMLDDPTYGAAECVLEGVPDMAPADFVQRYTKLHACALTVIVTRIEFAYRQPKRIPQPHLCRVCGAPTDIALDRSVASYCCRDCIRSRRIICPRCASLPHRVRGAVCDVCGLAYRDLSARQVSS